MARLRATGSCGFRSSAMFLNLASRLCIFPTGHIMMSSIIYLRFRIVTGRGPGFFSPRRLLFQQLIYQFNNFNKCSMLPFYSPRNRYILLQIAFNLPGPPCYLFIHLHFRMTIFIDAARLEHTRKGAAKSPVLSCKLMGYIDQTGGISPRKSAPRESQRFHGDRVEKSRKSFKAATSVRTGVGTESCV